ncbi:unnamed protein product [Protopolystoma xenopodis]|uniref:Uncharacterized protein n=1 Tax=Protopolystoma xenopodis TaxID=117903 RepID=A0A448X8H5_9PLAT|nr:unnamed protein product [Protopolystoma xenopodis]
MATHIVATSCPHADGKGAGSLDRMRSDWDIGKYIFMRKNIKWPEYRQTFFVSSRTGGNKKHTYTNWCELLHVNRNTHTRTYAPACMVIERGICCSKCWVIRWEDVSQAVDSTCTLGKKKFVVQAFGDEVFGFRLSGKRGGAELLFLRHWAESEDKKTPQNWAESN